MWRWKARIQQESDAVDEAASEDFAWRTHQAITEWTAKVDVKASIILTLETAMLGFVIALSNGDRALTGLSSHSVWIYRAGLGMLALAAIVAGAVVFPRLNRLSSRRNWRQNYIYFGHLRHWDSGDLAAALGRNDHVQDLAVLSRQLIATARIAWQKHALLQVSMLSALTSCLLLTLAAWT